METQVLTNPTEKMPALFDDFFRPWNDWFDNGPFLRRTMTIPAVNITEEKNEYTVSLAVPGMKKDDFKIDIHGTLLTISCEKDESSVENGKEFTRREYNYYSFSRSFSLPEEINREKIEANYKDGVLSISLPYKEEIIKPGAKHIAVK